MKRPRKSSRETARSPIPESAPHRNATAPREYPAGGRCLFHAPWPARLAGPGCHLVTESARETDGRPWPGAFPGWSGSGLTRDRDPADGVHHKRPLGPGSRRQATVACPPGETIQGERDRLGSAWVPRRTPLTLFRISTSGALSSHGWKEVPSARYGRRDVSTGFVPRGEACRARHRRRALPRPRRWARPPWAGCGDLTVGDGGAPG